MVHSSRVIPTAQQSALNDPANAAMATPSTTTTGTANSAKLKRNPKNTMISGNTNSGMESAAAGTPSEYFSNTPASMAAAMRRRYLRNGPRQGLDQRREAHEQPRHHKGPQRILVTDP